ncbi:MAG: hypothetical protein GC204_13155 [Chloroflexi bacterium]|nr:hypothetical protein [Chloroflexota bacterium]
MAGTFDDYVIREHPDYTEQLGTLAVRKGLRLGHFRKALNIVFHLLARNPTFNPVVATGAAVEVRIAKTEVFVEADGLVVPPLQIYYVIWEDEKVVELIKIEKRPGFGLIE